MDPMMTINGEALEDADSLEHHGTLGMKWGRWNEETRRRYMRLPRRAGSLMKKGLGEVGSAAKKGADKVARVAKNTVAAQSAKRASKKIERAELNEQRKELGMTRAKYDKLRERTLKSHDPTVVAKGMHTLTDKELDAKITRLQKEETISKLSTSKETRKHNESKARSEAIQANPAYKIGKQILDKKVNQWLDKKVGDGAGKVVNDAKKEVEKVKNEGVTAQQTKERVSEVAPKIRATPVNNKSAVQVGQKLLTDGSVKAEVIDAVTIDNKKR